MKTEYCGDILSIRAVEDCIRATKRYTKGVFRKSVVHPVQGEEFPSRVLTEYYEVYPDTDVDWDMKASDFWAWIWGDVVHVDVFFRYNYTNNTAKMVVHGGNGTMQRMVGQIPDLGDALNRCKYTRRDRNRR